MTSPGAVCLNCNTPLTGEYCASCGQKVPHTNLTLREFVHETTEQLVNWDGKIPRTLRALLTRPGVLTVDFLEGRRARWLLPLRVYLICSIAFFLSKPLVERITHRSLREAARISIQNDDGSTALTPETIAEIEQGLPARIFGKERLMRAANNPQRLNDEINVAFPKAMFVLLPFFALLTRIAWHRRLPRYPAHLYFALHLHAAIFAAMILSTLASGFLPSTGALLVGLAVFAYTNWYTLVAFRVVFGESWGKVVGKATIVGLVYGLAFFLVSLTLLGYALMKM